MEKNSTTLQHGSVHTSYHISTLCKIIVLCFIMVFALIGNIFLLSSFLKAKRIRNLLPSILIINLACCDILIVTTGISVEIARLTLGYFPFGEVGCRLLYPLSTLGLNSAVLCLLMICIDRYIATIHPFRYRSISGRSKFILPLGHFLLLLGVLPYSLHLAMKRNNRVLVCDETWSTRSSAIYTIFLGAIQYAIPLPIMIVLYTITWVQIKKQNDTVIKNAERSSHRRCNPGANAEDGMLEQIHIDVVGQKNIMQQQQLHLKQNGQHTKQQSRQQPQQQQQQTKNTSLQNICLKAFKHLRKYSSSDFRSQVSLQRHNQTVFMLKLFICILLVFGICMLPNQIIWLYSTVGNLVINDTAETVAYWLTYANSVLNPIIYGLHPKFRKLYSKNFADVSNACKDCFANGSMSGKREKAVLTRTKAFATSTSDFMNPDLSLVAKRTVFRIPEIIASSPIESHLSNSTVIFSKRNCNSTNYESMSRYSLHQTAILNSMYGNYGDKHLCDNNKNNNNGADSLCSNVGDNRSIGSNGDDNLDNNNGDKNKV